ncbi:MAG: CHAT domain-containing protein [Oculatellaceae cyanobacterium Prado106]|jgi:hypothetical protein|nr:CHAT domain-containing protein [Oculatellaceae cyanobacterium Prado106]
MKRILALSANPQNTDPLRLSEEVREIDEGLKRSPHRDQFELVSKGSVRLQDFYRHMLEVQPYIVHFSGHGAGEHGIVLENDSGKMQLLPTEQLAAMFKLFASNGLECMVLNACYSQSQAKAINQFVPYVIGMSEAIGDRAAITFAVAFYDTLGAGKTIELAFELAKAQLIEIDEDQKPILMFNPHVTHSHPPLQRRPVRLMMTIGALVATFLMAILAKQIFTAGGQKTPDPEAPTAQLAAPIACIFTVENPQAPIAVYAESLRLSGESIKLRNGLSIPFTNVRQFVVTKTNISPDLEVEVMLRDGKKISDSMSFQRELSGATEFGKFSKGISGIQRVEFKERDC